MQNNPKQFNPSRLHNYSKSEIIKEIQRVVNDVFNGVTPNRNNFEKFSRVKHPTIAKYFGTYKKAIQQAGFNSHRQTALPRIPLNQITGNLKAVLERSNGYSFTQDFYKKNGGLYSPATILKGFNVQNWKDVMQKINAMKKQRIIHTVVSPHSQRRNLLANLTKEDLFNEIDRVWQAKHGRPTYDEFSQASKYGITIYISRFGTWTKAIEIFCQKKGLSVEWHSSCSGPLLTKGELLNELREFQRKFPGDIIKYDPYKSNGGTFSKGVFVKHFGSWTKAVNAVGGVSGEQSRYSKNDLFNEIQRLWEQFGKQPTQVQMWKLGKISPKVYAKLFGSWTKAIHAFCEDRNNDTSSDTEPEITEMIQSSLLQATPATKAPITKSNELSNNNSSIIIKHSTGRTITPTLRFRVFRRDNFTCKICGKSPMKDEVVLEIDHIIPYSTGGETAEDNLQTLCKECNRGKTNLPHSIKEGN